MVVGTPRDTLDCGGMRGELADGSGAFRAPNEQLVVVSTRCQQVVVEGPFKAANLLGVPLVFRDDSVVSLPDVSHEDASIS